jgi:hypothetical protein
MMATERPSGLIAELRDPVRLHVDWAAAGIVPHRSNAASMPARAKSFMPSVCFAAARRASQPKTTAAWKFLKVRRPKWDMETHGRSGRWLEVITGSPSAPDGSGLGRPEPQSVT